MKQRSVSFLLAAAGLLFAAASPAIENPAYRLAAIFSGTWQGTTPGNTLRLNATSLTTDPAHPYDLYFDIAGKYQADNVRLQGVMRFDPSGNDVLVTYVPHFDPTFSAL